MSGTRRADGSGTLGGRGAGLAAFGGSGSATDRPGSKRLWQYADLGSALDLHLSALDTENLTIADTDKVEQWDDLSGNARHCTSGGTARPSYGATGGPNSQPAVVFGGSPIAMAVPEITATPSDWNIFVALANPTTSGTLKYILDSQTGRLWVATAGLTGDGISWHDGSAGVVGDSDDLTGGDQLLHFQCVNADPDIYIDGVSQSIDEAFNQRGISGNTKLGSNNANTGNHLDVGTGISLLLIVRGAMTASDRQRVEGRMAHDLGMTGNLPAGHPYKSAPPRI